ncbi:MAG: hypothetical protein ABI605_07415 [Rhizobacter sp.]
MHTRIKLVACGLLASVLLAACGGSSDGPVAVVTPDVPDEALASSEGYTEWAKSLKPSDSAEPLSMERLATAPSSETAEPVSLD